MSKDRNSRGAGVFSGLIRFAPPPGWVFAAVKTTAPIALVIVTMTLIFGMQVGPLSLLGSMTAVWGRERPVRLGLLTMGSWTVGITTSLAIGVAISPLEWLTLPVTVVLALVGVLVYNLLPSTGPGPLNLFFACALGAYLGTLGDIGWRAVLVTFLAGLLTMVLCQALLIRDLHGPERRAVERAELAVERYLQDVGDSSRRWEAHRALHRASALLDGAHFGKPRGSEHVLLEERRSEILTRFQEYEVERLGPALHIDDIQGVPLPGYPSLAYRVRREFQQQTFGKLTALRVAFAIAIAGVVSMLVGTEHFYWSILTAGVILHVGPNRTSTVTRALHRALGTLAGVGLVAVLALWAIPAPLELAIVILGAFGMNLFLAHHYALAVMFVTPMSLMITNVMAPGMLSGVLIPDRIVETLIGAAAAVLATAVFSTRGVRSIVRGQLHGTAKTIAKVIEHVERGQGCSASGKRQARELCFELDTTGAAVRRAEAEISGVGGVAACEATLVDLGYDVLMAGGGTPENVPELRERLRAIALPV